MLLCAAPVRHPGLRRDEAVGQQLEVAALGDPVGVQGALGERQASGDLVGGGEVLAGVLRTTLVGLLHAQAEATAGERVVEAVVLGAQVTHLRSAHHRQREALSQAPQHAGAALVPAVAVVEELHVKAVLERPGELPEGLLELTDPPLRQQPGRQALAAAGQQDEVVGVRQQDGEGDVALGALVRMGEEAAEGPVPLA